MGTMLDGFRLSILGFRISDFMLDRSFRLVFRATSRRDTAKQHRGIPALQNCGHNTFDGFSAGSAWPSKRQRPQAGTLALPSVGKRRGHDTFDGLSAGTFDRLSADSAWPSGRGESFRRDTQPFPA